MSAVNAGQASRSDDRVTELYRKYGPAIHARCRRILRDPAAAEDATQETFLRVVRHLESAPNSEEALRWIYRIATNYCLNEIRNHKSRTGLLDTALPAFSLEPTEDRMLDQDLGRRLVLHAPERVRAAAWLHHVDGLDQAEVASVLGVSRRTVVSYLGTFLEHAKKFATRSVA
jgi:RNA polymerase sigma-70 factor (ECF subfamily)